MLGGRGVWSVVFLIARCWEVLGGRGVWSVVFLITPGLALATWACKFPSVICLCTSVPP